jgi:hypothetical protein
MHRINKSLNSSNELLILKISILNSIIAAKNSRCKNPTSEIPTREIHHCKIYKLLACNPHVSHKGPSLEAIKFSQLGGAMGRSQRPLVPEMKIKSQLILNHQNSTGIKSTEADLNTSNHRTQ